MYVILPGEIGYSRGYDFINAARKTLEEAEEISADANFVTALKGGGDLTQDQDEKYVHYIDTAGEFLFAYAEYSNEPLNEDFGDTFALFVFMLAVDEFFREMVGRYFRVINEVFVDLIKSSHERNIRIRGPEIMLDAYACIGATMKKLDQLGLAANYEFIDTMDDLYM